jgi:AcrR family transcriptional regulator
MIRLSHKRFPTPLIAEPPTTKRRRLSRDARRETIEEAALAVFAERGYHGASIGEIARRAGVTAPIVYDHFESKLDLHRRLLQRTREELLGIWGEYLQGDSPIEQRVPAAVEAWARYVETHPYAPRMYFVETTGIAEIQEAHEQIQAEARMGLALILGAQPGGTTLAGSEDPLALEMAAETIRAGLTGLAIWWLGHPEVPRARVVETALNVVWIGLERASRGEAWQPE